MLARRYRLEDRQHSGPDGSVWRAVDETLERQVSVRVLAPGHPHAADVIDAARRAALVEDPRLTRVLDVGNSGGVTYIVSEHVQGRPLAELLNVGPLPAETVRRIVGEAAQALDRAGARGLHHQRLSPSSIVIQPDGSIKIVGTAVEASLNGAEPDNAAAASRADAVGLVNIIYAGLTGRWPGAAGGPLGPAPRVTGRAVPPGELVAGVPNDLDTLCTVTLGPHEDGPRTPAELAEQLSPWAHVEPLTDPRGLAMSGPRRPSSPASSPKGGSSTTGPTPRDGVGPMPSVPPSDGERREVDLRGEGRRRDGAQAPAATSRSAQPPTQSPGEPGQSGQSGQPGPRAPWAGGGSRAGEDRQLGGAVATAQAPPGTRTAGNDTVANDQDTPADATSVAGDRSASSDRSAPDGPSIVESSAGAETEKLTAGAAAPPVGAGDVDEANEPTVAIRGGRASESEVTTQDAPGAGWVAAASGATSAPDTPQSLQLPTAYARDRQAPAPWAQGPADTVTAAGTSTGTDDPGTAWGAPLTPRVQDLEHAGEAWPTPSPVAKSSTPASPAPPGAVVGYGDLASEILGRDSAPGMHRLDPAPPPALGGGSPTPWSAEWGPNGIDNRDRLGPFMPPVALARPPKSQTQLVLAVVAGLVVLGLILAVVSLRGLFSSAPLTPDPKPSGSASAFGGHSTSPAGTAASPSVSTGSVAGAVLDIAGVKAIDPQGDGSEGGASAPRIIDDDPTTFWRSERYNSATFGGLGKTGVGLVLDLGGTTTVTQATVQFKGSGGTVELRSATDPAFEGSELLAAGSMDSGSVVLTAPKPVSTRYLVLWFTKVPLQTNGEYRLLVSEVSVR